MRNNMIVNNTAYYDSSCIEKGSSAIILNLEIDEEDKFSSSPISSSCVCQNHFSRINVYDITTKIINKTANKYDLYKKKDFYILQNNKDSYDSFEYKFSFLNINVQNALDYSITVLDKKEKYATFIGANVDVIDSDLITDIYYSLPFVQLITKDNKDIIYPVARKDCMLVTNLSYSQELINYFDEYRIHVSNREEEEVNIRTGSSLVIKTEKKTEEDGWTIQPTLEMGVSNISTSGPVDSGSNSGGDLKSLQFTIQQMSFFEFKLSFENKMVEDTFNLPLGLFFDKDRQRIIGTPMQSGRYSFALIFDDATTLNGYIDVPKLNREL